jgi:hypothetical protein
MAKIRQITRRTKPAFTGCRELGFKTYKLLAFSVPDQVELAVIQRQNFRVKRKIFKICFRARFHIIKTRSPTGAGRRLKYCLAGI